MAAYRLLRVCQSGYYRNLFTGALTAHELKTLSYQDCLQQLRERGFLYPGHFAQHMTEFGVEVFEIVADYEPLQKVWAHEAGLPPSTIARGYDFLVTQIKTIKPDILYFQDFHALPHSIRKQLKQRFPYLKIITGFQGFPMNAYDRYADLDLIFISYPAYHASWKKAGVPSHTLYHCFDAYWNRELETPRRLVHDFAFIGSSGYGSPYHAGRFADLEYLLRTTSLEVWGYERPVRKLYESFLAATVAACSFLPKQLLAGLQKTITTSHKLLFLLRDAQLMQRKLLPRWPWYLRTSSLKAKYPERCHAPLYGQEYMELIRQTKVIFNRHTDESGEGGNIRTFEVTGLGRCLLTDMRPNISDLFTPGEEIMTYSSIEEAARAARYLLDHSVEREKIAAKAKERVWREHLTRHRCQTIHTTLLEALAKK